MGSITQDLKILGNNGESPPKTAIKDLKAAVNSEVLLKGEADEEAYRAAIDRWNKGSVKEAVKA
jgi:hypothetical protein